MALRVLLADESTTIKKVMALALQDFAVEVKAVHVGVDVLEVARSFRPDLIFADVLLQKRNGYQVATDLKTDSDLRTIPVVLMWSSFMDLDEEAAVKSGADRRLEKPFDVEALRKVVLDLVPRTRSQRLAHFLEYPKNIEEPMRQEVAQGRAPHQQPPPLQSPQATTQPIPQAPPPPSAQPPPLSLDNDGIPVPPPIPSRAGVVPPSLQGRPDQSSSWSAESFEDISQFEERSRVEQTATQPIESSDTPIANADSAVGFEFDPGLEAEEPEPFQRMDLSQSALGIEQIGAPEPAPAPQQQAASTDDGETWSHADLSKFKVDLPPVSVAEGGLTIEMGEQEFTGSVGTTPVFTTNPIPPPAVATAPFEFEESFVTQELNTGSMPELSVQPTTRPLEIEQVETDLDPTAEVDLEIDEPAVKGGSKDVKMDAETLEVLIRAQSREIIEEVVRKIVPDLAATIIREELERLLEDTQTSARRSTKESPRP